jgi:hypothetical protein
MNKYRIDAKVDSNQTEIVKALEKIPNLSVEVGHDDILIGYRGKTYWIEVKSPEEISKRTGNPFKRTRKGSGTYQKQQKLKANWKGHYAICVDLGQILREIGITK